MVGLVESPAVALRKFRVAPGLAVELFAAEPDVRNPVSLSVDEHGRVFVVESDRRRSSVFDIRNHRAWLDADFSFRTIADRAAFLRGEVTPTNTVVLDRLTKAGSGDFRDFNHDGTLDWHDLEVQSERIRLLEDNTGAGRAERVSVLADGFTNLVAGVAAGVLARLGDLYFTCIPDVWRFQNYDAGAATAPPVRQPIRTGFGVHIAFGGHDMHGLIFGPDGRLYWSIADRGTDTNLFSQIRNPLPGLTPELLADSGCVFRANPDGTDLEVVAWGLRNPQELAFDEWGNLFTADNNGDGGDKARWHYVVDGADFGWRMGWQWLEARAYQPKMGPWNGERLWHLATSNTAAWLLPPLAHIGHGPAGLAYNPGTGLPAAFDHHFFLCDFPGSVLIWTNAPAGASFEIGPVRAFFGELGPTDIAFHPDGGVLVTDWFKTFDKTDKGRIYRVHAPSIDASAAVRETRRLLRDMRPASASPEFGQSSGATSMGAAGATPEREAAAIGWLGHADQRVREAALAEIVANELASASTRVRPRPLVQARQDGSNVAGSNLLARVLALRALERVELAKQRAGRAVNFQPLVDALSDTAPEIRAQAARGLGALNARAAGPAILPLLVDSSARVRFFAAQAIGALRVPEATQPLCELLRQNADRDLYLRHAAVLALARLADTNALLAVATSPPNQMPRPIRLGVLLALRRLQHPAVAKYLDDPDPALVLEAARAIHDTPIAAATAQLAGLLNHPALPAADSFAGGAIRRRVLNANFRLGGEEPATALGQFAGQSNLPPSLRIEALELLADWPQPRGRDHFLGLWRPLPRRDATPAVDALRVVLPGIVASPEPEVAVEALRARQALGLHEPDLLDIVTNRHFLPSVRAEALRLFGEEGDPRLAEVLPAVAQDLDPAVRVEATRLQSAHLDLAAVAKTLAVGTIAERQGVLVALAQAQAPAAGALLGQQLDAIVARSVPPDVVFDILEAASSSASSSPALRPALLRYTNSLPKDDPLAVWRPVLHGGDPQAGRRTFFENQQIACFRCHKIQGEGGEVGPDLAGLVARQGREYVLDSILNPNKAIAPGFESVLVTMKSGSEYAGLVKSETPTSLVVNSPEDGLLTLLKADIAERRRGLSAMPEGLTAILSPRELRDLIAFLATAR